VDGPQRLTGLGTALYFDGYGRGLQGLGCFGNARCSFSPAASNAEFGAGIGLMAAGAGSAVAGTVMWIVGQTRLNRLNEREVRVSLGGAPAGSLGSGVRLVF
jgi:hypothetical protein